MQQLLKDFGNDLKRMIADRGMNQGEFADAVARVSGKPVNVQQINAILNGRRNLTIKTILRLMQALDMKIEFIISPVTKQK